MSDDAKRARDSWLSKVLGFDAPGRAAGGGLKAAQAQWAQSRGDVLGQLQALEKAIRAMEHPQGDPAIILVRAISANLTASLADKRSVAELRRYLETDSIIDDAELPNGFGIEVSIRAPLTQALDALDRELVA